LADAGARGAGERSPDNWETWANNIINNTPTSANNANAQFHQFKFDDADEEDDDKKGLGGEDSKNLRIPKYIKILRWPSYTQPPFWAANLVLASRRVDRKEIDWFNEIGTKSFEGLADLGRLEYVSSTSS
jgi:hypothetical protein